MAGTTQPIRVLITGASIAGPVTAYWLARAGNGKLFDVTVLERAPEFRPTGQGIDVRGAGVEIMRRMGLEEAIKGKSSREEGVHVVDGTGRIIGSFPVGEGEGLVGDIEIPRGDLARLIMEKAESVGVKFVYGDYVDSVEEVLDEVDKKNKTLNVTYTNSKKTHEFDLLVIGDGLYSRTREIVFGKDTLGKSIRNVGAFVAWFSIPREDVDDEWSRLYNIPGRRSMFLRPDNTGKRTLVVLGICTTEPIYDEVIRSDIDTQKELWVSKFTNTGWQAERVVQGIRQTSDFYMQKLAQIRMDRWTKGRVALVGDAGYCPTPLTGMGTTCAIVGAYVLAGEVARSPEGIEGALRWYEARMSPFVKRAQKIPPGAPKIANPETEWGIWILRCLVWFVSWSGIYKLFLPFLSPPAKNIILPDYDM